MANLIDRDAVRKFLTIYHSRAAVAFRGVSPPGTLNLCSMSPDDNRMLTCTYTIGDIDHMLAAAIIDSEAGKNVYVEVRTVNGGRPNERGKLEATVGLFAFVVDHDNDTGKAGNLNSDGATVVETSPGNFQCWYFLDHAIGPQKAKEIGDAIRKASGADACTGTVTQPFRIAGLPNFPTKKKIARGRDFNPAPTRIVSMSDKRWSPDDLLKHFSATVPPAPKAKPKQAKPISKAKARAVESRIAKPAGHGMDRSAQFQSAVNSAARVGMTPDQFEDLARNHPEGCSQKFLENGDRLKEEVERSFKKAEPEKKPEPIPDHSIDGAELLDRVYEFCGRFVCYPSQHARAAHALWCAHTHLMGEFETTPRLAFLSAEPASGKTRALEISELLVPSPVLALNVSPAYLIRKIADEAGVTILYDEIDALFGGSKNKEGAEDIRGLLNGGYRRGAVVGRCYMSGSVALTEELQSFAPVALGGLGGGLPDTVLSRSIVIRMKRRAPHETVTPFRRRHHAEEGQHLCGQLAAWAAAVAGKIAVPDLPEEVVDRDADIWEPLVATADAAGSHWPDTARVAAVALVAVLRDERVRDTSGIQLLADLRTIYGEAEGKHTKPILQELSAIDESSWADIKGHPLTDRGLAGRLRGYGIKSKLVRIGAVVARGYRREDLHDAWARYLPPE